MANTITNRLLCGIFSKNFYLQLLFRFILVLCISCKVHSAMYSTEDAIIFEVEPEGLKFKRGNNGEHSKPADEYPYDITPPESSLSAPHETSEITNDNLCYTKSEKEGRCMVFRDCFPLLFVDDLLQNPGLAEILFQSAGNCNITSVGEKVLSNSQDSGKPFNKVNLRKQKICCAGYKQAFESQSLKSQSTPSQQSELNHKGPGHAVSHKLPTIDPVESTIEEQGETSEENSKPNNAHSDSKPAPISNIELVLAEPAKSHAPEANNNHNHIKLPVLPEPIYDLSPWLCPGRHIFMPRGQWPWMVSLLQDGKHFCSGTLIDKIHLLTSASCIYQLSAKDVAKVRVIIGDRVMYATSDGPHSWRKVVRITRHLQYNHQTLHNDIAILAMDSPIQYTPNIQPVNLPVTENRSHLSKAIVTGWSGVDIGKPNYDARSTKDSILELMDWRECHKIYDGFATGGITRDMLCTRTSNSSCVADLGSGLVAKTDNCWHLIGIVSFGLGCGNFPEVYTDVSRYLPWIQKNIKHYQYKSVHEILPPLAN